MSSRYAIYFAPPRQSPWWAFGARWLGRDEQLDTPLVQPVLQGVPPDALQGLTEEPRRYGFHATLKPPFHLAVGSREEDLLRRLEALAPKMSAVALGPMRVASLGRFVALVPATPPPSLWALATACVTGLDDLRAPLTSAEFARRQIATLTPREAELLGLYGYPHVLERFRFHMTLTGPVEDAMALRVIEKVTPRIAALNVEQPLSVDRLCLFVEKSAGAPLQRVADFGLAA